MKYMPYVTVSNTDFMNGFYKASLASIFISAAAVFVLLFFISAPYGRFRRKGWGPTISSRWAWMVMEFLSPALMAFFFIVSEGKNPVTVIFISGWLSHYIYRTFIYPFRQSGKDKPYPLILVIMAMVFNLLNGFVNGFCVFHLKNYELSWIFSWQFLVGLIIFVAGFVINKISDEKLRSLRSEGVKEYVIPYGWLFRYVSSPHYFGEIVEWMGWAIMTWSLAGLAFFVFTFANLFPRAISAHKWYHLNFPDYPPNRKAILPFII